MTKQELRSEIRRRKRMATALDLQTESARIADRLLNDGLWRSASTVLAYSALPDEPDLSLLLQRGVQQGKTMLLPVVVGDSLILRRYTGEADLAAGAFGILEPQGDEWTDPDAIDLVLVPGMAFDGSGRRLGRGKGYYDRLLPRLTRAYRIGVCFSFQRVEKVPVDAFDQRVNEVVQ